MGGGVRGAEAPPPDSFALSLLLVRLGGSPEDGFKGDSLRTGREQAEPADPLAWILDAGFD